MTRSRKAYDVQQAHAKKKGPNKSQKIREALEKNSKASAKEEVDALASKGIKVAVGPVYMVKSKMAHVKAKRLGTANLKALVAVLSE